MTTLGFLVEFEVRPGKEEQAEEFFRKAKTLVDAEPGTLAWFAFQVGPRSYRIFDAFKDEDARQAHLNGEVRKAIENRAGELFTRFPTITPVDLLATKLPG